MDNFDFLSPLIMLIEDSWLLQGLLINTTYTLLSIPFTSKIIANVFKNRKKIRIVNARQELYIEYIKRTFTKDNISAKNFKNLLYIIANKYNLLISDVYGDDDLFLKNITTKILNLDIIDDTKKEQLIASIRKKFLGDIYILDTHKYSFNDNESEEEINNINDNISSYEEATRQDNLEEEKKAVRKYTFITSILLFLFLFFFTSIIQLLYNTYNTNGIVFINVVITAIVIIPILANGMIHFDKFNNQNKKLFLLLIIILLLNIINFIYIISTLFK